GWPALRERRHCGLARRRISMSWCTVRVMLERERPHPRHSDRCGAYLENAADNEAAGEHVEVVVTPLAGWARSRRTLKDQVVLLHRLSPTKPSASLRRWLVGRDAPLLGAL